MKQFLILICIGLFSSLNGQFYKGEIYIRDKSNLYLNQFYVTNVTLHKTVLADYNGNFAIPASAGDIIRFTSIVTERKDIEVTPQMLTNLKNYAELQIAYYEIQEVVIKAFKPSGNLRKDVSMLKPSEKAFELRKVIGLPEPKGDGTPPEIPVLGFNGGLSLSIDSFYDIISGEAKKKKRYYEYEKMSKTITNIQQYYGDDYFIRLKIPKELIPNFLQFVYSSDNLNVFTDQGNYEPVKIYFEKYLPIYMKRLRNSSLMNMNNEN